MSYITSTLVEFERDEIGDIPDDLLARQKLRLRSFYYELHDSYLRGGKYIVRYAFYTLKAARRLTPLQLRRQFAKLAPRTGPVPPEAMEDLHREAGGRGIILYRHGDCDDGTLERILGENALPAPAAVFREDGGNDTLDELKKAAFYAFKKDALLLLVHGKALLENPQFYTILDEYHIPVRSLSFPWLCRNNLKLMQAMTIYKMTAPP